MSRLPETLVNIPALMSFTIADLSHLEQLSDEALTARLESKEIDASGSRQQQMARVALLVLHKKGDISADPASSITTSANASSNASKNRKKKLNKKRKIEQSKVPFESTLSPSLLNVEIEYIQPPAPDPAALGIRPQDPAYTEFERIFARFSAAETATEDLVDLVATHASKPVIDDTKGEIMGLDENLDVNSDEDMDGAEPKLSRRKMKKFKRLSVAQLKKVVDRPDAVEWVDVTSSDPQLLIHLKTYRNSVPVPQHWSQKRKYLQSKRGVAKQPFELPTFIAETGIGALRETGWKSDTKSLAARAKEKMMPKMGKMEIDYQRLHDAFFRYQTKPPMSRHGETYYEGKEFETKLKEKRPGFLSQEIREALGLQNDPLIPPPWLINMQRYGPPPSYPLLKIPGLNAPIPEGAEWGYHPGGWGKPPVDEYNRPLYGDVFGLYTAYQANLQASIQNSTLRIPENRKSFGDVVGKSYDEQLDDDDHQPPQSDEEMEEVSANAHSTEIVIQKVHEIC